MDNFQAYGEFARVYDMFQDNVDYQTWGKWLKQQLAAQGITDGLVLDLGCGTGTMTEILAEAGYDMIGVDNSGEMLAEAMEKRVESGHDILYLLQDMQEFELYGTVRAVVSVCDSLNYITEEEELEHVFALVNNYLDPQGTGRLQRTEKMEALSGRTVMMRRPGLIRMSWLCFFQERTDFMRRMRRFTIREPILWRRSRNLLEKREWSFWQCMMLIHWSHRRKIAEGLPL